MGLISQKAEVSQSSLQFLSVSRYLLALQVVCWVFGSSTKLLTSKGSVVVVDDVKVGRNSSLRQSWVSGRYVQGLGNAGHWWGLTELEVELSWSLRPSKTEELVSPDRTGSSSQEKRTGTTLFYITFDWLSRNSCPNWPENCACGKLSPGWAWRPWF